MQNIVATWQNMSGQKKTGLLLAAALMLAAMLLLGRMASAVNYQLLYSGLDGAAAGEVISAIEARGARYEVRGEAIYVDHKERDRLRMALAAEGLPAMGAQGYELLDELSGFGTTSQMFDAAYWRAKEGELARTIVAAPHIRSARVHISAAATNPFERDGRASAAVTVSTFSGPLTTAQVRALRHLVAAAVSGLAVQNVAIIDDSTGLVASGDDDAQHSGADPLSETMKGRVERILAARVGPGNAVVEVSVETVTEREKIIERLFDPDTRVAISAEVEERSESQQGGGGGQVTVASNLPDGDAADGAGGQSSSARQTRERTNFEVSETQREVEKSPGDIRKLTVAVLLNDEVKVAADGTVTRTPRTVDELTALRGLVASAVGFDEGRGDVITIESMTFERAAAPDSAGIIGRGFADRLDVMALIQATIAAIVVLILGLFVLRPILASSPAEKAGNRLAPDIALPMPDEAGAANSTPSLPDLTEGFSTIPEPLDFGGFETASDLGGTAETPVERLRNMIAERQEESLQILQSWIDGEVLERETGEG